MQPGYHQVPGTRGTPTRQGVPARGRAERPFINTRPTVVISEGRSYAHITKKNASRASLSTAFLAAMILLGLGIVFAAPPVLIGAAVVLTVSLFALAVTVAAENALRNELGH